MVALTIQTVNLFSMIKSNSIIDIINYDLELVI